VSEELTTKQIELLQRIANSLDTIVEIQNRIELAIHEKSNKTLEIKETRELMRSICTHYKNTQPTTILQVGSRVQIFRFRNAISQIMNIENSKREFRRLNKYIRKLEEHEFIVRDNADIIEILSTGENWGFK
jgi:hypothetical protein